MKKKNRNLLLIVILIIILIITIIILTLKKDNNTTVSPENEHLTYYEDSNIDKLAEMTEKERIKFYFAQYIENLENGELETNYNLLYGEFKNSYFPTLEAYKEYVQNKYPEIIAVDYDSFEREGVYYIISTTINDLINEQSFEQKFIIREYDFNDYAISFQAE